MVAGHASAQAGSGSSGFGGGGGGSSSRTPGKDASDGWDTPDWIILGFLVAFFGGGLLVLVVRLILFRRTVAKREALVQAAAAEAAEDDPAFAADAVRAAGRRLFLEAQRAWDARDRNRLRRIVARC